MKKRSKSTLQEETVQTVDSLSQDSLAGVRGGDGNEPSPDDDNDMRGHLIETG